MAENFGLKAMMDSAESKCLSCGAPFPEGREEQCKFVGGNMVLCVLGKDDEKHQELLNNARQALNEKGLNVEASKVTDDNEILKYDIRKLPALVINGSIISQGIVSSVQEIKEEIEYMY